MSETKNINGNMYSNGLIYLLILILPFIFFYWMIPFFSDLTIGEDYSKYQFSIIQQLELQFSLKNGSFPLYVPNFANGQSAAALTLGQMFHPISHLASILPGYWNGNALEWNSFLRLLSLGFAHLSLFAFLKKLPLQKFFAFSITLAAVYNLRMLDLFRYGASLESWTGYLFLCSAIGMYYIKPSKWQGPLCIIFSTYWLICSGHPQMMYYGLLGASIFTFVIPFFSNELLLKEKSKVIPVIRFFLQVFLYVFTGILMSSIYILPFYFDFITTNVERVANDYSWANTYLDTVMGTLNNLFFPLQSDVHGAFGGSSLFLMVALIPIARLFRVRIPAIIWTIWIILFLTFFHMQGDRLPVHYLVWKYFPLASSFRIPGRISLIMPIFFMLALAWMMSDRKTSQALSDTESKKSPAFFLSILSLFCLLVYLFLPEAILADNTIFTPVVINNIPAWVKVTFYAAGFVLLSSVILFCAIPRRQLLTGGLLCASSCIQILFLMQYGTWIIEKKDMRSYDKIVSQTEADLRYSDFLPGSGMSTDVTISQAEKSFIEPFLGKIYHKYKISPPDKIFDLMSSESAPDQIFIEEELKPDTANSFNTSQEMDYAVLKYSSFNRLLFEVRTNNPGFFSLAYPFSTNWKAFVNDETTKTYRANGANIAVLIPSGKNRVEFRYWSRSAYWGMVLTCTILFFAGCYFYFIIFPQKTALILATITFFLCIVGFYYWQLIIYNGKNLNTEYMWQSPPASSYSNIAYGKKTEMSSRVFGKYPYVFSSSQAVDGSRKERTGFITKNEKNPWWVIDLRQPTLIGCIMIYENEFKPGVNKRPLVIAFSNDKINWKNRIIDSKTLHLNLRSPLTARYIRIIASGICHLSFSEVEIYPKDLNRMANDYYSQNKYYEALFFYTKLLEIDSENPIIEYNTACIYSKLNQVEKSLSSIKKAIEKGYDNYEKLRTDPDLITARLDSNFSSLLKNPSSEIGNHSRLNLKPHMEK